ncbi:apoptosis inducing factor isoform X2 [Rhodnius prolixus]
MQKAVVDVSKLAVKLCRCLIHTDFLSLDVPLLFKRLEHGAGPVLQSDKKNVYPLSKEVTEYINIKRAPVLLSNLKLKQSSKCSGGNPINTNARQDLTRSMSGPFSSSVFQFSSTNSSITNVKKVQYLMRRAFHWQHWKRQRDGDRWKTARTLLGVGVAASALFALIDYYGITRITSGPSIQEQNKPNLERCPIKSKDIPGEVEYLIVGGGAAAFSACRTIKGRDATAKVLIITKEPYYPYMKPPLTKELVYNQNRELTEQFSFQQWNGKVRSIFYELDAFYTPCEELQDSESGGIAVARGWTVVSVNSDTQTVTLEDGKTIKYRKCLLATGSTLTKLKVVEDLPRNIKKKITYYNNLADFKRIDNIVNSGAKTIGVYGSGLECCELACSLALRGKLSGLNVVLLTPSLRLMQDSLPPVLSELLRRKVEDEGVTIESVLNMECLSMHKNNLLKITLSQNRHLEVDHLIICTPSKPDTEIAAASGLEVDNHLGGFLVNSELAVSSNLFAAGDCASYYDEILRRRRNVRRYDHAIVSGRVAAENMTGAGKPIHHQAMLWSEFGTQLGFEAVGNLDCDLETVGYFRLPDDIKDSHVVDTETHQQTARRANHKGVVFYMNNEYIEGILMWNLYDRLGLARQVLAEKKVYPDLKEIAKLFDVYKD